MLDRGYWPQYKTIYIDKWEVVNLCKHEQEGFTNEKKKGISLGGVGECCLFGQLVLLLIHWITALL